MPILVAKERDGSVCMTLLQYLPWKVSLPQESSARHLHHLLHRHAYQRRLRGTSGVPHEVDVGKRAEGMCLSVGPILGPRCRGVRGSGSVELSEDYWTPWQVARSRDRASPGGARALTSL